MRRPAQPAGLIERAPDLAKLVSTLTAPPAVVAVKGEAGVGKTRLIDDALRARELADRQLLVGHAHPVRDPFPLGPWLEALASARFPRVSSLNPVVGVLRALLPERVPDLPPAPEPLHDPHAERHRTVRAIVDLVNALGPAILVLEDVHWADARSFELLELLVARTGAELAIVVSYRPADVPPDSPLRGLLARWPRQLVTEIELAPLSPRGVAALAAQLLGGGEVSAPLERQLAERTGGVPLIVEEDVQLLRERQALFEQGGVWRSRGTERSEVPPVVASAVVERAARLAADARAAMDALAVLGVAAEERLIGTVAELDQARLVAALSEALDCGLLREQDGSISFRHALAREAIYQTIPGPRRRWLHAAAAAALEVTGTHAVLGALAHHYLHAGNATEWARAAEAAAGLASSLGEDETAYNYLVELLRAGAVPPERRAAVTAKLAWDAPFHRPSLSEVERFLADALVQPGLEPAQRGELRMLLGFVRTTIPEEPGGGIAELREAAQELRDRPDHHARTLATLAAHVAPDQPWSAQRSYLEEAWAAARRSQNPIVELHVASNEVWFMMMTGHPGAWKSLDALPQPGRSAAVNRQVLRARMNAARYAFELGHYARARALADESLALCEELHVDRFVAHLKRRQLEARWRMGDVEGVEAEIDVLRQDGLPYEGDLDLVLGWLRLAHGRLDEARQLLSDAVDQYFLVCGHGRAALAAAGLTRILDAVGEPDQARACAEQTLGAIAATELWLRAAPLLGFAPLEAVLPRIGQYKAWIAGRDAPLAIASLTHAEGRIAEDGGDLDAAATAYAAARERYAELPDPWMVAHAAEAEARVRIAGADTTGEQLYQQAWRAFINLDAPWEVNRVAHAMRRAGLVIPHRGGRRSYGTQLSPREQQVAELAAAGRTNREIAEQLFLSPRTIDSHLASVLRKLEIDSRHDLARALDGTRER